LTAQVAGCDLGGVAWGYQLGLDHEAIRVDAHIVMEKVRKVVAGHGLYPCSLKSREILTGTTQELHPCGLIHALQDVDAKVQLDAILLGVSNQVAVSQDLIDCIL